jgi:hypothetical protein
VSSLAEEATAAASQTLARCVTPIGLRASADEDGYDQVWARDSMVALLGICAAGLDEMVPALRASLVSLADAQSPLGYVPLFVEAGAPSGQGDPGGIDGNLWFVIGHHVLHRTFGAADLLDRHRLALARAMFWSRCQDSDDDGLIEAQEAADWADLMANHGKTLYANVLFVLALRAYVDLAREIDLPDADACSAAAERADERLNLIHWVSTPLGLLPPGDLVSPTHPPETRRILQLIAVELWNRPYYLPWVGFRDFGDWCDVPGNIWAILAGVADGRRRSAILDYFADVGIAEPIPARTIHPPIHPGDPGWRSYYRNGNLNMPYHYHNGGSWPSVGGLLVAALVADGRHEEAASCLERLILAARGESGWAFNEWHHGVTGRPMGKPHQAWSAAMLLFAQRAVESGQVPCLSALSGASIT